MMFLNLFFNDPNIQALGWALAHFVWQGILLVGVLALVNKILLRHYSANLRYIISCLTLFLMLLTLTVSFFSNLKPNFYKSKKIVPDLSWDNNGNKDREQDNYFSSNLSTNKPKVKSNAKESSSLNLEMPWKDNSSTTMFWLVSLWALGVFFITTKFFIGYFLIHHYVKRGTDFLSVELENRCRTLSSKLGITQVIGFYQSTTVKVPMVIGWLKPVILIPVSALTGLTTTQLDTIILHELAHVRRYDYLVNIFQTVIETLLFYHPAVWWVSNQIRIEREHCCDDIAVAFNGDRLTYAKALINLEEFRQTESTVMAANGGILMERVKRLLTEQPKNTMLSSFIGSLICLFLLATSALSMMVSQNTFVVSSKQIISQNRSAAIGIVTLPIVPKTEFPENTPRKTSGLLINELKTYQIPELGLPIMVEEPVFETKNTFINTQSNTQSNTQNNSVLMEVEKAFIENENSTEARINYARELLKVNRYEEALNHYLWCYDEGSKYEPEYKAVCLNLLLLHISDFRGNYKPAIDALIERCDKMEEDFLKSEGNDFETLRSIVLVNNRLEDGSKRSLALFDTLKTNKKRELLATMTSLVLDDLLAAKRYKDIMDNSRDISKELKFVKFMNLIPASNNKTMTALNDLSKKGKIEHVTKYFIALLGVNDIAQARNLAQQIINSDPSQRTFSLLIEKANEFGANELAQDLVQEAYKAGTEAKIEN